jgi:hypothetical protein
VRQEFKKNDNDEFVKCEVDKLIKYSFLVSQGGEAKTEAELIPPKEKILSATLRFIIRRLVGNVKEDESLNQYINPQIVDIWDEDLLEQEDQLNNLVERMSESIKVSSIFSFYNFIKERGNI